MFRRIVVLVAAFAGGVAMQFFDRTYLFEVGSRGYTVGSLFFFALFALCIWLVFVHHRSAGDSSSYQIDVLVVWLAAFSGFSLMHGGIWSDAVFGFGLSWAGSAIVGGLILAVTRSRRRA